MANNESFANPVGWQTNLVFPRAKSVGIPRLFVTASYVAAIVLCKPWHKTVPSAWSTSTTWFLSGPPENSNWRISLLLFNLILWNVLLWSNSTKTQPKLLKTQPKLLKGHGKKFGDFLSEWSVWGGPRTGPTPWATLGPYKQISSKICSSTSKTSGW